MLKEWYHYTVVFQGRQRLYYSQYMNTFSHRVQNLRRKINEALNGANSSALEKGIYISVGNWDKTAGNFFNYSDLVLHSHFCLVIAGDMVWSYRLMDVMSAGCIPVIVANGWTLPFENLIDWKNYVLFIDENLIINMDADALLHFLWNSSQTKYLLDQFNGNICLWHLRIWNLYKDFFSSFSLVVDRMLQSIDLKLAKK
ncbi:hypothetical protein RFI_24130 [Reticulomyxa filosa]|uniref:Exostosin GT47 domain-containing protein n=1 Tax=Reticulomyxa filosa TaxID=46433 RepID=X6MJK1_RETFI|nr:hypothetical protein RFI_24130 [Reticulomyxa filosa]|eukprot:ETO13240.1 hypothetical protein RFI_24130 [Reticulomyxa filosa]